MKMSSLFNNGVLQGALAVFIGALILGLFGWLKFKRDNKIVTDFLKKSGVENGHATRTTDAIYTATQLNKHNNRQVNRENTNNSRNKKDKKS